MSARMVVDPGALRVPMVLERGLQVDDGLGGQDETWLPVATVHARVERRSDRQDDTAGQDIETTLHAITIRHRADVESGMRLRLGARVFRIVTVTDPDETGRFLVCNTEERP